MLLQIENQDYEIQKCQGEIKSKDETINNSQNLLISKISELDTLQAEYTRAQLEFEQNKKKINELQSEVDEFRNTPVPTCPGGLVVQIDSGLKSDIITQIILVLRYLTPEQMKDAF